MGITATTNRHSWLIGFARLAMVSSIVTISHPILRGPATRCGRISPVPPCRTAGRHLVGNMASKACREASTMTCALPLGFGSA